MFQLFWVQTADGTWVLDHANAPEQRPFHVMVRDGSVIVEWRKEGEETGVADPDEARWLATRLMEAAVLADCSLVGLLVESVEVEGDEEERVTLDDPRVLEVALEAAEKHAAGDDDIVDAEIVEEGLAVEDDDGVPKHEYDDVLQQWRRVR